MVSVFHEVAPHPGQGDCRLTGRGEMSLGWLYFLSCGGAGWKAVVLSGDGKQVDKNKFLAGELGGLVSLGH